MATIHIEYQGGLHCEATHTQSGVRLATDAPKDNQGKGESFSPTDLVATALGTCMLTLMGIAANAMKIELGAAHAAVEKEMAASPARRIGKLGVTIRVPAKVTPAQQQKLEQAALTCPVHKSLHPDIQIPVKFEWA